MSDDDNNVQRYQFPTSYYKRQSGSKEDRSGVNPIRHYTETDTDRV